MTESSQFDGETYDAARDHSRLFTQLFKIRQRMSDGQWHTLNELAQWGNCSVASASARVRDLRKPKFGGHEVERRYVERGLWQYRLIRSELPIFDTQ